MTKLLILFFISLFLAYQSDRYTQKVTDAGYPYTLWTDKALVLLIAVLSLFAGLRTNYNDTAAYINGFNHAPGLWEFLSIAENRNPFTNPLFYAYQSMLKTLGFQAQSLIFTTSVFTQTCFVLFFKRYSKNFLFSIFLYFTLGTFCVSLAAMKQITAMAVLTLGFKYIEQRKWGRYYIVVIAAMLIHTYALTFAILPFFTTKTWKHMTYILIGGTVFVLFNFREVISEFMDEANELGKSLAEYEVFGDHTVNLFRVLVYVVPPLFSFLFQKWLYRDSSRMDHVLSHMAVISLCFMLMGTKSGANMFARMAYYFEIGTIAVLPWLIRKPFEEVSYKYIEKIALICFFAFFIYAYGINIRFDEQYEIAKWHLLII